MGGKTTQQQEPTLWKEPNFTSVLSTVSLQQRNYEVPKTTLRRRGGWQDCLSFLFSMSRSNAGVCQLGLKNRMLGCGWWGERVRLGEISFSEANLLLLYLQILHTILFKHWIMINCKPDFMVPPWRHMRFVSSAWAEWRCWVQKQTLTTFSQNKLSHRGNHLPRCWRMTELISYGTSRYKHTNW